MKHAENKDKYTVFKIMMVLMTLLLILGVTLLILGLNLGGDRIILPGRNAL